MIDEEDIPKTTINYTAARKSLLYYGYRTISKEISSGKESSSPLSVRETLEILDYLQTMLIMYEKTAAGKRTIEENAENIEIFKQEWLLSIPSVRKL